MSAILVENTLNNSIKESKDNIELSNKLNSLKLSKDNKNISKSSKNSKLNPTKEELEFLEIIKDKALKKANNPKGSLFNKGLILDSSTSKYYTPYKDYLLNYKPVYNKSVIIANSVTLPIKGIGDIPIFIRKDTFYIKNVNYVPNIKTTLISSKELTNKGQEILFKEDIVILSYNNKVITNAKQYLNTYFLSEVNINYEALEPIVYNIINYKDNIINYKNPVINLSNKVNNNTLLDLYHRRFLHINKDYIIKSAKNSKGIIIPTPNKILSNYDHCYYGKFKEIISRKPYNPVNILEFIDCDILGPFKIKGQKGENYIFTITCRASKYIWIYAIRYKSDIYNIIINYYNITLA